MRLEESYVTMEEKVDSKNKICYVSLQSADSEKAVNLDLKNVFPKKFVREIEKNVFTAIRSIIRTIR